MEAKDLVLTIKMKVNGHFHRRTQFKKRTTHLDISGSIYDLYQHVEKTCPFCKSTKPRPDRTRVSGFRAEEFGELILLDMCRQKWETKPLDFFLSRMERDHIWQHIHAKVRLHRKLFPNFPSGWTLCRWIRKQCVQTWLSTILTICRPSIESTTKRHFPTRPHAPWPNRAEMGVRLFKKFSSGIRGYGLEKSGPDHSGTSYSCALDA